MMDSRGYVSRLRQYYADDANVSMGSDDVRVYHMTPVDNPLTRHYVSELDIIHVKMPMMEQINKETWGA